MSNDNEDDNNLEEFLVNDGNDFLSEEARQAEKAKERRLARKRRLQQRSLKEDDNQQNVGVNEKQQQRQRHVKKNVSEEQSAAKRPKAEDEEYQSLRPAGSATLSGERLDNPEGDKDNGASSNGQNDFDMFSMSVSPVFQNTANVNDNHNKSGATDDSANVITGKKNNTSNNVDQQQDWDDAEGYYKATIGEVINLELGERRRQQQYNDKKNDTDDKDSSSTSSIQFRVAGVIGKGVFSTVLKCNTEGGKADVIETLPSQVALKCIRHNDTMAKAAQNEIRFLQRFKTTSNNNTSKRNNNNNNNNNNQGKMVDGIVELLLPTDNVPLEFRGHTVLVFPYMEYNLRDVLTKFGKGIGLSLTAVRSYFGQMLAAAIHMKQHNIVHSDLKPDNILVSADFAKVSLCDFGSAMDSRDAVEMITPYLVSRFYRAPEIILGLIPTFAIDLWSLAVTVGELFLGRVLFQGKTNNDMLHVMMQHMGPFSNRLIRQHLVQTKKFPIPTHFTQEVSSCLLFCSCVCFVLYCFVVCFFLFHYIYFLLLILLENSFS